MPAKHQINLSPKKNITQTPVGKFLQWALTYGRYIIIGTEIVVLLAFISRFKLDRDLADLREKIAQKQAIVEANREFEAEIRTVHNRFSQVQKLKSNQGNVVSLLAYLEKQTPSDVTFKTLSLNDTKMEITVDSASTGSVTALINTMRTSPLFTSVSVDRVEQKENAITFTITANLKK